LTGVESVPVASLSRVSPRRVLVVADAERLDPRSLASVISTAEAARASVVLVAGDRAGWRDAVALEGIAGVVGIGKPAPARVPCLEAVNEVSVESMNVVFTASSAGLRDRVMADSDASRERGERAVVVVGDRCLVEELSALRCEAVSPSRAHELTRAGQVDRLLVLGDASALSRAARRATEGRRDHYVVDRSSSQPPAGQSRAGAALEIALPARIERELGPRLDDPAARSAWRIAAAAHECRGPLAEVELREALRDLAAAARRGSELAPDAPAAGRSREGRSRSLPPR